MIWIISTWYFPRFNEQKAYLHSDCVFLTTNLWPNRSVDFVSDSLYDDGEQQITIVVLQFPPNESWRILVILLSRYGTYVYIQKQKTCKTNEFLHNKICYINMLFKINYRVISVILLIKMRTRIYILIL